MTGGGPGDNPILSSSVGGRRGEEAAPWRRLSSRTLARTPWFVAQLDEVIRPDGSGGCYGHVVVPGSVTVLAVSDDLVAVTRQWIYTHGGWHWRLPGGQIDPCDPGPEHAARRELHEETGIEAARWRQLGRVHGADSVTNHVDHVFVASDLRTGPASREPTEADLQVSWWPLACLRELVTSGAMPHAGSAFAVLAILSDAR